MTETEMYVTAHFIEWEGDETGQMFLIPKVSKETMGVYGPEDDIVIISTAAIFRDTLEDGDAWVALAEKGSMFRPFLKKFVCTLNHELLHATIECEFPWQQNGQMDVDKQEWVIERMGWT